MKVHINNPDNTIIIERCHGDSPGYILTEFPTYMDSGEHFTRCSVYEQDEDMAKHKDHVERLLWGVLEALGEINSKHDPQRINIEVENNE